MTIRISSSVGAVCLPSRLCSSPSPVAATSPRLPDRLVRVPRVADRQFGAGGRPGRGGSHRSERPEYDTPPAGGSQAKNTRCSGWSGGATATCGFLGLAGLPTVRPRGGVACPRSCGGRPPLAWRLSTASWVAVHGLYTEQPFYCSSVSPSAASSRRRLLAKFTPGERWARNRAGRVGRGGSWRALPCTTGRPSGSPEASDRP